MTNQLDPKKVLVLDITDFGILYGIGGSKLPQKCKDITDFSFLKNIQCITSILISNSMVYIQNKATIDKYINKYISVKILNIDRQLLALYGLGKDTGLVVDAEGLTWKIVAFYSSYRIENSIKYFKNVDKNVVNDLAITIFSSIKNVDIDLRKKIANNIVIVGKTSISKVGAKLIENLNSMYTYTIYTPHDSENLPWIGGSIATQLEV